MKATSGTRALHELAGLYGVQTAYYDVDRRRRAASTESLLAVLNSMGASMASLDDVPYAIRERKQELGRRALDPVVVDWEGGATPIEIRLPQHLAEVMLVGHLMLEDGERERWEWHGRRLRTLRSEDVEGQRYIVKELPLKGVLPWGYHRLTVDIPGRPAETMIISAPLKAYSPGIQWDSKHWGAFLPLYSLHTRTSWGCGSYTDLEALTDWVTKMGGGVVATLPLLAAFLDEPFEPSPYAPASRLLWNELYVDVNRALEGRNCESAQIIVESQSFQAEVSALRNMPLVDYRRQMALKRQVLEELARSCYAEDGRELAQLQRFVKANPVVEDYASFRAACEQHRLPWPQWPESLRRGFISQGDYDEDKKRYHVYAQWLAHQQMTTLSRRADEDGSGLYLDLPLGVHAEGYDVWQNQDLFIDGTHVGAPPDPFFMGGQDWGFPPLHPDRIRKQGYKYLIDVFRHHLRHAGVLRIDHVMGLHRLYWVPQGHSARQGAYVRYPAEELYAILTLESHREQSWIVGENLGTVPSYVNSAMSRHGLGRMYVARFEMTPDHDRALNPVSANTVASFNTHDLPTFAAFWKGADIQERHRMGFIDEADVKEQKRELEEARRNLVRFLQRKGYLKGNATPEAVHAACMKYLSASSSHLLLVNLEDLWLEEQPQNVPGTGPELPNWRRKARYSFEEFTQLSEVVDVLREIDQLRK